MNVHIQMSLRRRVLQPVAVVNEVSLHTSLCMHTVYSFHCTYIFTISNFALGATAIEHTVILLEALYCVLNIEIILLLNFLQRVQPLGIIKENLMIILHYTGHCSKFLMLIVNQSVLQCTSYKAFY